ncbi:MAG: flagellar type III secretion system pore protein FliP [Gammaproteobacteria bacterium]|nr:flagellar type III secretion system pore protein FliP [Gammaproteobacteria bacterium]
MFKNQSLFFIIIIFFILVFPESALSNETGFPGVEINFVDEKQEPEKVANALKIILGLTILSIAPAIMIVMTSFTRIIVVLAMLRHAFGMQQTPPNTVLISLALFLTLFNMTPVLEKINSESFQPFIANELSTQDAFNKGMEPLRDFMIRQTRENDIALMIELSDSDMPANSQDIKTVHLIPAFMISELKTAFQIGFVIFLPFLIVDLVIASILMSMGMLMVPPMMISLPIKILMFVLIDGWNIVIDSLMSSFN